MALLGAGLAVGDVGPVGFLGGGEEEVQVARGEGAEAELDDAAAEEGEDGDAADGGESDGPEDVCCDYGGAEQQDFEGQFYSIEDGEG